jgi:hypothetical protein
MGMKHLLIALLVFTTASFAQGQTAKVIKVKGQQAIVQFPAGTVPQVGQQLDLGGGSVSDADGNAMPGLGSRKNLIGLGVNQLYFLNNSATSKSVTGIKLNGRYGWNTGRMEFGPIATLEYESRDNSSTRLMAIGGFFDYNFTPNISGQKLVYAATGDLSFGQLSEKQGSFEPTSTIINLFVGGTVKWFGLSDHFALRADAGFNLQRSTPDSGDATSLAGAMVRAGIANYF